MNKVYSASQLFDLDQANQQIQMSSVRVNQLQNELNETRAYSNQTVRSKNEQITALYKELDWLKKEVKTPEYVEKSEPYKQLCTRVIDQNTRVMDQNNQIENKEKIIQSQKDQIEQLTKELIAKDSGSTRVQNQLEYAQACSKGLVAKLKRQGEEKNKDSEALRDCKRENEDLKRTIQGLEKQLNESTTQISLFQDKNGLVDKKTDERESEIQSLRKQLLDQGTAFESLESLNNNFKQQLKVSEEERQTMRELFEEQLGYKLSLQEEVKRLEGEVWRLQKVQNDQNTGGV